MVRIVQEELLIQALVMLVIIVLLPLISTIALQVHIVLKIQLHLSFAQQEHIALIDVLIPRIALWVPSVLQDHLTQVLALLEIIAPLPLLWLFVQLVFIAL